MTNTSTTTTATPATTPPTGTSHPLLRRGKGEALLILGCGPGGYATAEYAAKAGLSVTVFEKAEAGGTCLNRGCIPTKVYCHYASLLTQLAQAADRGIITPATAEAEVAPAITPPATEGIEGEVSGKAQRRCATAAMPGFSFPQLFARKEEVVEQLREGVETLMTQPGITLVRGEARLKDAHTVSCGGQDYHADHIIIATGSHPTNPPIPGIDSPGVVSSTGLLAMTGQPRRLVIIGAGVIGMEMASAFAAFGTQVTVVEFLKECLPMADADLAKRLRKQLEKRGVTFFMQAAAKSIGDKKGTSSVTAKVVTFEQKGKTLSVEGDVVLCATGRGPNTAGIGLDEAGISYDRHGITTDDNMQTTAAGVYAIGDVNGRMQLAHAAEAQGRIVVDHILGRESKVQPAITPWAVFTMPEMAGVGPTEAQLKADGTPFETRKSYYRANGKAVAINATDGMVKVTVSPDGRLLSCHALGAHAADLVQEVAALMGQGATAADLDAVIHIHPTLQELL